MSFMYQGPNAVKEPLSRGYYIWHVGYIYNIYHDIRIDPTNSPNRFMRCRAEFCTIVRSTDPTQHGTRCGGVMRVLYGSHAELCELPYVDHADQE